MADSEPRHVGGNDIRAQAEFIAALFEVVAREVNWPPLAADPPPKPIVATEPLALSHFVCIELRLPDKNPWT
jgi:hypothetical protein